MKRAVIIVLDGCGAGEAPDAEAFGDFDHPATLRHVWESAGGLKAPTLVGCGLFAAAGVSEADPMTHPLLERFNASYGRLRELSQGKDSVTGHWEMAGIVTEVPFPTYPDGFPDELIEPFQKLAGVSVLGNRAASGTEIIEELGPEHQRTGNPIVYTSADSVFQIACHLDVVPLERLYELCLIARKLCQSPNNVERVIARPFVGSPGAYTRTGQRRDYPLTPPPNLVDRFVEQTGEQVYGVGVVPELFDHRGFRVVARSTNNAEHAVALEAALESDARLIWANFEDFDMKYGHRNDALGFAKALEDFDKFLASLLLKFGPEDLLILTADHGNDPTAASTDHSREFVPFCKVGEQLHETGDLGDQEGMSHVLEAALRHLDVI